MCFLLANVWTLKEEAWTQWDAISKFFDCFSPKTQNAWITISIFPAFFLALKQCDIVEHSYAKILSLNSTQSHTRTNTNETSIYCILYISHWIWWMDFIIWPQRFVNFELQIFSFLRVIHTQQHTQLPTIFLPHIEK